MFDERGKIADLAVFSVAVNLPELYACQQPHNVSKASKYLPAHCYHRQLLPVVPCREVRSGLSIWVRSRCARTPATVQPSSWVYVRLVAVRSGCFRRTFRFIEMSEAREPSAEVMGRPQPRGAVLRVRACVRAEDGRAVCYRERFAIESGLLSFTGVTANVC